MNLHYLYILILMLCIHQLLQLQSRILPPFLLSCLQIIIFKRGMFNWLGKFISVPFLLDILRKKTRFWRLKFPRCKNWLMIWQGLTKSLEYNWRRKNTNWKRLWALNQWQFLPLLKCRCWSMPQGSDSHHQFWLLALFPYIGTCKIFGVGEMMAPYFLHILSIHKIRNQSF